MCIHAIIIISQFNTLRPRQNGRHFADDIFKCIFLNENVWIPNKISLKFVPKGPINNIPAMVQIKAWRRPGDKPLSEPMVVSLPTHICVTRPQWVNPATLESWGSYQVWWFLDSWCNLEWNHLVWRYRYRLSYSTAKLFGYSTVFTRGIAWLVIGSIAALYWHARVFCVIFRYIYIHIGSRRSIKVR